MKISFTKKTAFFLFLIPALSFAQSISGSVYDKDKIPLQYASIAVLDPESSLLVSYANADKNGFFELKDLKAGKLIFQIHLIGFKTYQKAIEYKNKKIALGKITLEGQNQLDEVVVTAVVPVQIKKDTIAFNTKAFKVRTEDTIEDLFKKLPGVEVDETGKVTAQGEDITKIYVDGKEFFSGDPVIATKNLSADAIASIEVVDEKSEKARVSGVHDAVRNKVINLKLKEDRKINDFGKAQAGYGTDDRYLTSLNYNRFSSKLQTTVIGKYNNVNTSGSDISQIIKFNGGRGGSISSAGFLTTGVAGVNMGYEFAKDKNLNADYFFNHNNINSGRVVRNRTEFINGEEIKTINKSESENISNSNRVNFGYRDRADKLKSLSINANGSTSNTFGESVSTLDRYDAEEVLALESESISNNDGETSSAGASFDLTKRFNEESKRHITTRGSVNASKSASESNNSQQNYYGEDDFDNSNLLISKKQDSKNSSFSYDLDYTEPITENHLIAVEVDIDYSTKDLNVDQSKVDNKVEQTPLIYKDSYDKKSFSGELEYIYDKNNFTISAAGRIIEQTQDFGTHNLENDTNQDYKKTYTNFNPTISIRYNKERSEFLRVYLKKRINLPSSSQLSPAINNFNPLYVRQGNPELIPEDDYSAFFMFGKHNLATGVSLFARLSYNYTENSIGSSTITDYLGVRYSSYENLGDKENFSATVSFRDRLNSLGLRYRIRMGANYSKYYSEVGFKEEGAVDPISEINGTQSKSGNIRLSLENNKKDKVDASIGATWNKNYTIFTSGNSSDRDYFQQTYWTKVDWNVTNVFNISSQFKYDIYTDSSFPTDQSVPIWNATISYALTKSKDLTVLFSALDILNKSIGLERRSSDNYIEEVNREVLGNYYMLSLSYNLYGHKAPKGNESKKPKNKSHS